MMPPASSLASSEHPSCSTSWWSTELPSDACSTPDDAHEL